MPLQHYLRCVHLTLLVSALLAFSALAICPSFSAAETLEFDHSGLRLSVTCIPSEEAQVHCTLAITPSDESRSVQSFRTERLKRPERIAIDLQGIESSRTKTFTTPSLPLLTSIRIGSHPGLTRVVLDVKEGVSATSNTVMHDKGTKTEIIGSVAAHSTNRNTSESLTTQPTHTPRSTATATALPTVNTLTPNLLPATKVPVTTATLDPTLTPTAVQTREQTATALPFTATPTIAPAHTATTVSVATPTLIALPNATSQQAANQPLSAPVERAKLAADLSLVSFESNTRPVRDVKITNQGSTPISLTASIEAMTIGDAQPPAANALVVSPRRFELQPGASRALRLLLNKTPTLFESAFHLNVSSSQATPSAETIESDAPAISILVLQAPVTIRTMTHGEQSDDIYSLKNLGNVSLGITEAEACHDNICEPLTGGRIFPNQAWIAKAPPEWPIRFLQSIGGKFERIIIPARR